jgi:hypothetical protein
VLTAAYSVLLFHRPCVRCPGQLRCEFRCGCAQGSSMACPWDPGDHGTACTAPLELCEICNCGGSLQLPR